VFVIPSLSTICLNCGESEGPALLGDPHIAPYMGEVWKRTMAMPKLDPALNHFCKGTDDGMRQLSRPHASLLTRDRCSSPRTSYGASVHGELVLFLREGLTAVQALAAATSAPAKCFHLSDRGAIRPGLRADLVLAEGDPTKNILATLNIVAVWKRGIRV
jgi:hypothetical protein